MFSDSVKHVDVKWNMTQEKLEEGLVKLDFVSGALNVADSLTKAVDGSKTDFCRDSMGVRDVRDFFSETAP